MKATGIIRRIDDLGRVVIPKEIRRTMGIKEGDPLEIFTEGRGTVCFKKYGHDLANEADTLLENVVCYLDADAPCRQEVTMALEKVVLLLKKQKKEEEQW